MSTLSLSLYWPPPGNLQCWCGGCWRETGTGHQQRHWAGTWYTGAGVVRWSLPSYGTQYSVLREGAYISTFTLKNLFLRTRYLFSGTFSEYWVGVNMVTLTNSGFSFWRHCFLLGMPELVTSCSSGQSLPLTPGLSNLLKSCYKPQHCHCHPTPAPDPPPLVTGAGVKLAGPDLSPSAAIFILHWRLLSWIKTHLHKR